VRRAYSAAALIGTLSDDLIILLGSFTGLHSTVTLSEQGQGSCTCITVYSTSTGTCARKSLGTELDRCQLRSGGTIPVSDIIRSTFYFQRRGLLRAMVFRTRSITGRLAGPYLSLSYELATTTEAAAAAEAGDSRPFQQCCGSHGWPYMHSGHRTHHTSHHSPATEAIAWSRSRHCDFFSSCDADA
jgi:hypothetical protein